jgi:glucokinase
MPDSPLAAGVDIGGTKIAVGLIDRSGAILAQTSFPTEAALGFERGVGRIIAAVDSLLGEIGHTRAALAGVGIGCAGPVHPGRGTIDNPHTLPTWDGVDIVSPLEAEFGLPAILENDADAAAVGEAYFGAGAGKRNVLMLTYGTGVGGGAVFDGRIYRGAMQTHPEFGHLPCEPDGPECYCGIRGCFESIASGTAISAAGEAAGIGDARAVFDLFAGAARRAIDGAVLNPRDATDVVRATLGNAAGIVGAAQLVRIGS